ncbi:NACalpha-BTF3-like transcription factor [Sulfitobacter geojensis]|nr:NACalpha-BTF3-like transcription factor [Sulfitobacter geojensis]
MSVIGTDDNGIEVTRNDLELVVSQTGAVWQNADGGDPVDPVDPAGSLVYSLVGDDTVLFQVDAETGQVSYQSWYTPSYNDVWDFNRDNIYEMSVIGTDDNGIEVTRNDLELVVSQTGAVWQNADGSDPVDPVDPVGSAIDVVRLATDPNETIYGIRDDTSSRGVDLDGALITATYADGSVEHLTWHALDPYTNGGATGTDINMFYGWSQHELTVTKNLASLEMDLQPASSVFDTTITFDDDPLGGSTPGSSFGYTFEFLGESAEMSGNVTATYSGIVNLVGSPADGDLYTTMLVDFSDFSGGGILGDVIWNSDIDTMRYAGDLVQKGTDAALVGNDMVTGTVAEDFLNGSIGQDTLIGLAGNDILIGGADADEFVFADGSGDDLIVDFDISSGDLLNIHAFGFADFNAVLAASADVGSDVVIQLDSDDSVTLVGVSTSDLTIGDFWLLP